MVRGSTAPGVQQCVMSHLATQEVTLNLKFVGISFKRRADFEKRWERVSVCLSVGLTNATIKLRQPVWANLTQARKLVTPPSITVPLCISSYCRVINATK